MRFEWETAFASRVSCVYLLPLHIRCPLRTVPAMYKVKYRKWSTNSPVQLGVSDYWRGTFSIASISVLPSASEIGIRDREVYPPSVRVRLRGSGDGARRKQNILYHWKPWGHESVNCLVGAETLSDILYFWRRRVTFIVQLLLVEEEWIYIRDENHGKGNF